MLLASLDLGPLTTSRRKIIAALELLSHDDGAAKPPRDPHLNPGGLLQKKFAIHRNGGEPLRWFATAHVESNLRHAAVCYSAELPPSATSGPRVDLTTLKQQPGLYASLGSKVKLSWAPVANSTIAVMGRTYANAPLTHYKVDVIECDAHGTELVKPNDAAAVKRSEKTKGLVTSFTAKRLKGGTFYCFTVRACNRLGDSPSPSPKSNVVRVKEAWDPSMPKFGGAGSVVGLGGGFGGTTSTSRAMGSGDDDDDDDDDMMMGNSADHAPAASSAGLPALFSGTELPITKLYYIRPVRAYLARDVDPTAATGTGDVTGGPLKLPLSDTLQVKKQG